MLPSFQITTSALVAGVIAVVVTAAAPFAAAEGTDYVPAADPTYKGNGVTVDEKLGAQVPLDAVFRTADGETTTLGAVLKGEIPTILTFNYSDCPMLCSVQLNGLTAALPEMAKAGPAPAGADAKGDVAFRMGAQFRVVTIDLEPKEPLDKLAKMRDRYVERVTSAMADAPAAQRDAVRTGWTYLAAQTPGDAAAIRRVADAVGFRYTYVPERAEWAHPAALIFLSSAGTVTRYVYGIDYDPAIMRESIFKAGIREASTAVGFMNRCYHFDPGANSHARAGVLALRLGAGAFAVMLGGAGLLFVRRKRISDARGARS